MAIESNIVFILLTNLSYPVYLIKDSGMIKRMANHLR